MTEAEKNPPEFRLDPRDLQSPVWGKLRRHMEAQLEKLRRDNDTDHDPVKTAKLRGRISALKNLLALGNPQAPTMGADEEQGE